MQHCDQTCQQCSRNWFRWLKSREAQMNQPRKTRKFSLRVGHVATVPVNETLSFNDGMLTAVRVPRPAVGARVQVRSLQYVHTAVVVHNADCVGHDGRRWVQVAVERPGHEQWLVHVERDDLVECFTTGAPK